jgi:hypothetical protein
MGSLTKTPYGAYYLEGEIGVQHIEWHSTSQSVFPVDFFIELKQRTSCWINDWGEEILAILGACLSARRCI